MTEGAETARLVAHVSGRVQGVGFRDWVRRVAAELELSGSATNLDDGRVEVVAEGPREAVTTLIRVLSGGRGPGTVSGVSESWPAPAGEPPGFRVR